MKILCMSSLIEDIERLLVRFLTGPFRALPVSRPQSLTAGAKASQLAPSQLSLLLQTNTSGPPTSGPPTSGLPIFGSPISLAAMSKSSSGRSSSGSEAPSSDTTGPSSGPKDASESGGESKDLGEGSIDSGEGSKDSEGRPSWTGRWRVLRYGGEVPEHSTFYEVTSENWSVIKVK